MLLMGCTMCGNNYYLNRIAFLEILLNLDLFIQKNA